VFANAHFTGFLLCARDEGVLLQGAKKSPALEGFVVFDVGNMIAAPYNDLPLCQLMGRMNTAAALDHKFGCLRLYKVIELDNQT